MMKKSPRFPALSKKMIIGLSTHSWASIGGKHCYRMHTLKNMLNLPNWLCDGHDM